MVTKTKFAEHTHKMKNRREYICIHWGSDKGSFVISLCLYKATMEYKRKKINSIVREGQQRNKNIKN